MKKGRKRRRNDFSLEYVPRKKKEKEEEEEETRCRHLPLRSIIILVDSRNQYKMHLDRCPGVRPNMYGCPEGQVHTFICIKKINKDKIFFLKFTINK